MKSFSQFYEQAGRLISGGPYSSNPRKPQVGDKVTDPEVLKAIELEKQIGKTGTLPTNVKPIYKQPVQQSKTEQPKLPGNTVAPKKPVYGVIPPESPEEARKASRRAFDMLAGG